MKQLSIMKVYKYLKLISLLVLVLGTSIHTIKAQDSETPKTTVGHKLFPGGKQGSIFGSEYKKKSRAKI